MNDHERREEILERIMTGTPKSEFSGDLERDPVLRAELEALESTLSEIEAATERDWTALAERGASEVSPTLEAAAREHLRQTVRGRRHPLRRIGPLLAAAAAIALVFWMVRPEPEAPVQPQPEDPRQVVLGPEDLRLDPPVRGEDGRWVATWEGVLKPDGWYIVELWMETPAPGDPADHETTTESSTWTLPTDWGTPRVWRVTAYDATGGEVASVTEDWLE